MPLCYSNFKSFRNKSSRIFLFEQLLFSKVNKLTCKGQVGLGLDGKGWWRANTGCNQLSDAIGNSNATSIKIEGCPCKLWNPYCPVNFLRSPTFKNQIIWVIVFFTFPMPASRKKSLSENIVNLHVLPLWLLESLD